jgi:putative ABC transport system permease protein
VDVAIPLASALKNDIPEIAATALAYGPDQYGPQGTALRVGDKSISPRGMIADSNFLKILQFPVLAGNPDKALNDPFDIVITESVARALFGTTDPIGKTIFIADWWQPRVTAVLKDLPAKSSLQFAYITPWSQFAQAGWVHTSVTNWNLPLYKLYVSLKPNVSYAQVAPKISGLVKKYSPATYLATHQQVIMQPVKDWHLYSEYKNGIAVGGPIEYVWLFGIIGMLVLAIACINFMNLSTARSAKRAKEVGIRKVVGSSRRTLIIQFLAESVIFCTIAFFLSLIIVQAVLPSFNTLARTRVTIPYNQGIFWLGMLSYILVTGLLAGCRPAFYLSAFRPVKVLKGTVTSGRGATRSRRVLVVLQFTCSIALITATIVIYQQIEHARNRPRGYDPNRLIISEASNVPLTALKQEMLATGAVTSVTQSLSPVTDVYGRNNIDTWTGQLGNEPLMVAMNALGDSDYFKTAGISFATGSNFKGSPGADTTAVILNEAAVRRMGLKQPLNQTLTWSQSWAGTRLKIIGVVHDAVTDAPFAEAEPTMYVYEPGWSFTVMYRLAPNVGTQDALERIRPIFSKYRPNYPFTYHFADDSYAAKFVQEKLVGQLAGIFAALAIFISCLGLFGLAAYMAEQRTKEIGIRKVLGASLPQVVRLISQDFIMLVGISCLIASPLAFYILQHWLNGYYYRIELGPGVFIASAAMAILITILTIGFQTMKAAAKNPVDSLRTE